MPKKLTVRAVHEGGMRMTASSGEFQVTTDYPLPPSEKAHGFTPLELVLASIATCGGSTVALLLGRMKQPIAGVEVVVSGLRRDEHPTMFTEISAEFVIHGAAVDPAAVQKVIAQADSVLCPVWAMIKPATPISTSFRIVAD